MNFLVIGGAGQLGSDLCRYLTQQGHISTGMDLPQIDMRDVASVRAAIAQVKPDVVVNCAAYTAVDKCESEVALAYALNDVAVGIIAGCCKEADVAVVHISTDYVFDGMGSAAYVETDMPNPQSIYGKSKYAGEQRLAATWHKHFIFRIAWLYGTTGANFVKTIRTVARAKGLAGEPLRVVDDQHGSPTSTTQVCQQILHLLTLHPREYGIYHCTCEGACTWYEFTRRIVANARIAVQVEPCTTAEFPRPAPRPAYSVLEHARLKKLGCNIMKNWEEAFDAFCSSEMQ